MIRDRREEVVGIRVKSKVECEKPCERWFVRYVRDRKR